MKRLRVHHRHSRITVANSEIFFAGSGTWNKHEIRLKMLAISCIYIFLRFPVKSFGYSHHANKIDTWISSSWRANLFLPPEIHTFMFFIIFFSFFSQDSHQTSSLLYFIFSFTCETAENIKIRQANSKNSSFCRLYRSYTLNMFPFRSFLSLVRCVLLLLQDQ